MIYSNDEMERWGQLGFDHLMAKTKVTLQSMFRATFESIKILSYIEDKQRWKEHPQYEDKVFASFLHDYFGITINRYDSWREIASEYGAEAFDSFGPDNLKKLKRVPVEKKEEIIEEWTDYKETRGHVPTSKMTESLEPYQKPKTQKPKYRQDFCPHCKGKIHVDLRTGEVYR